MSAPKPWERKQTAINSTPNSNDIISRSGEQISANPQLLATNAMSKGNDITVHKTPSSTTNTDSTNPTTTNNTTTGNTLNSPMNRTGYGSGYNRMGGMGGMSGMGGMGGMGGMYGGGMGGMGGMYGGGMGGMGGMYGGGMGGMGGMYGGGMGGMGGMYGGGMGGNQGGGFFNAMNQYVFSF